MPIDLYETQGSAPCSAVRLVAAAAGVDLNRKQVDLMAAEHLKPEFLKINPQHTVPTIDDNGFYLWESRAICLYLVEKYAKNDSLYPKCPKKRAVINQRLYFDLGTLYGNFGQYLYPQVLAGAPADPAKLEKCHEAMAFLDGFLQGKEYIAGDQLTVADLSVVTSAVCYSAIPNFDMGKYKNVEKWIKKISAEAPKYEEIVGESLKDFKGWIESALKK